MLDPRIYRAAFLPTIAAVVLLMFAFEPAPEPLEGPASTPTFQGTETARVARSIAVTTPSRAPGSVGDRALSDRIREHFLGVDGGEVAEQTFEGSFEGEKVELQNVLLTLPGRRQELLVVVAGRDSAGGQGATTSAAATAVLMRLATELGNARHERTIVLASVPGSERTTDGISELTDALPTPAGIDAAIAIAQPGVEDREPPFVFPGRARAESVPATLIETAAEIGSVQFGAEAYPTNAWQQFTRLAVPVGVGDAAALADQGVDTIGISGSGERPAEEPESTTPGEVSSDTVFAAGSTALNLLLTLDERSEPLDGGPSSYLRIGDNLLPGWPIRLLALTLIVPALLAAGDVWLRDRRRDPRTGRRALPWALERALLPLAALLLAYALALVGLIPRPSFPYDPGRFAPGVAEGVAIAAIALAVTLVALLIRPLRVPLDAEPQTLASAAGLLCAIAVIGIWLLNPFMGLLLAPVAHVWLLPARAQGPPRARTVAVIALVALAPALAAGLQVASYFDLGAASATWHLLLLIVAGQIGLLEALLWCLMLGGLLACIAATRGGVMAGPGAVREPLRGPGGYAGPGSLGGAPSNL